MCSSQAARERNFSSIIQVSGSSSGARKCMNTHPGSVSVFLRIDCSWASASARRSSRGLMVTTRYSGPSCPSRSSSDNWHLDRVLQSVDEGVGVLTLDEGGDRIVNSLLEVGRHQFAVGDRQQNLVFPQRLRRLSLIGRQRRHVDVVANRYGPLQLVELQRCLRVRDG